MSEVRTETLSDTAVGLDARPRSEAATILVHGQIAAAQSVEAAVDAIASAAARLADTIRLDGVIHARCGNNGL